MSLPNGFVYLSDLAPTILQDLKYFTNDNILGRPLKGYEAARCILTKEACYALIQVQQMLLRQSLELKIFDGYRPQMAVDDFVAWCNDFSNQTTKRDYYPNIAKADFCKLNYLAMKSSHSRGSTVDLTIIRSDTKQEIDMGTRFDFMDEASHPFSTLVSAEAQKNRLFFRNIMEQAGFKGLDTEWWHFTLKNEPFPETYYNFPVI